MLPENAYFDFTPDLRICRLLNGLWQISGAHGAIDPDRAVPAMRCYHDDGFTTWDLADHYGPAEDFIGAFRHDLAAARGPSALADVQAFTKWVPRPQRMTRPVVENAIGLSLRRMGVPALDLLQFHWWEYRDGGYMDGLRILADLRDEGLIRHLALTNFDTQHVEQIVSAGIGVVSNQVQYSLVDLRPQAQMTALCQQAGVTLLAYGTLCGGLLSDTYLGQPEPTPAALNTASLRKYKNMIDAWGGWGLFQVLLVALRGVADRHGVSIANVAVRYILDQPAVAGVIAGARLGISDHRADNARVFSFNLEPQDIEAIQAVTARARDLFRIIGDCGDEYRR